MELKEHMVEVRFLLASYEKMTTEKQTYLYDHFRSAVKDLKFSWAASNPQVQVRELEKSK